MVGGSKETLLKEYLSDFLTLQPEHQACLVRFMATREHMPLRAVVLVVPSRFHHSVWEYKDGTWKTIQSWIEEQEQRAPCLALACSNNGPVTPESHMSALIFTEDSSESHRFVIDGVPLMSSGFPSVSLPGVPLILRDLEPDYLRNLFAH